MAAVLRVGTRICVLCRSRGIKARVGKQLGPAHLRTPLQLVLAQTLPPLVICAHLPGQNRWINTEPQTNYEGSLPLPWWNKANHSQWRTHGAVGFFMRVEFRRSESSGSPGCTSHLTWSKSTENGLQILLLLIKYTFYQWLSDAPSLTVAVAISETVPWQTSKKESLFYYYFYSVNAFCHTFFLFFHHFFLLFSYFRNKQLDGKRPGLNSICINISLSLP